MNSKNKAIFKLILLFSIIVVLPIILYFTCKDTLFNSEWLIELPNYLSNYKSLAAWVLIGLQALQIIICIIPGQPIQFATSYMFGVPVGLLISLFGSLIGVIITFYLAKSLGSDSIKSLFGAEKVENYQNKINSGKGLLITFIIYLIPGFPKDLVAYVAGISKMQLLPFIIISTVGRTPGMMLSLYLGKFFQSGNYIGIALLLALCIILLIVCYIKKNSLIALLNNLEERDLERKAKHNGKKSSK